MMHGASSNHIAEKQQRKETKTVKTHIHNNNPLHKNQLNSA